MGPEVGALGPADVLPMGRSSKAPHIRVSVPSEHGDEGPHCEGRERRRPDAPRRSPWLRCYLHAVSLVSHHTRALTQSYSLSR